MRERLWRAQAAGGARSGRRRVLRRLLPYLRPYRGQCIAVTVLAVAGAVAGLIPAVATRNLVDQLTHPRAVLSGHVLLLVLVSTAAALAASGIFFAQSYLAAVVSQGITRRLSGDVFARIMQQPVGYFSDKRGGELISLITNDVDGMDDVVSDVLINLGTNAVIGLSTLALMFTMDWRLTLLSLVLVPLGAIPSRRFSRANFRARQRVQEQLAEQTAYLHEFLGLSGVQLIKAFGAELRERARFGALCRDLTSAELKQAAARGSFQFVTAGLTGAAQWAMWLAGGLLVATGRASLGTVVAFIVILLNRMGSALGSLGSVHAVLSGARAIAERILDGLDEPVQMTAGTTPLRHVAGHIRLDGVWYTYPGSERPALRDIRLEVLPGELIALVGPSGAGKTTLVNLACRFLDPTRGTVTIDGTDVRDADPASLRDSVGMVLQDTYLFHATIRENLRYARPGATDAELEAAARAAHAHEFISRLPAGYDTVAGERGYRLSGGERQRIAIARALVKDAPILILDEATSNLDSASERLIQDALRPLLAARTSVVIAHRLSTIMAADRVVVLSGGAIVEQGTHPELLARDELYASLFRAQFAPGGAAAAPPAAERS
jgi:ATP-binding cassette subfamily B protein